MPSDMNQFIFCTAFLVIGAFLEAYIIGGITAELINSESDNLRMEKEVDYVKYSMELHYMSPLKQEKINRYMDRKSEY